MKRVSLINILWGVAISLAVLHLKTFCVLSLSRYDYGLIREKVMENSDHGRKKRFFFVSQTYLFFVTQVNDEITIRTFRIFGFPMTTFRGELRTGEISGVI